MRPLLFLPLLATGCFGLLDSDKNDPPDIWRIEEGQDDFTDARPLPLFVEVSHSRGGDYVRDGQLLARDGTVLADFQRGVGDEWLTEVDFEDVAPVIRLNTEWDQVFQEDDEELIEFVVQFTTEADVAATSRFETWMHCSSGVACDGVCVPAEDCP